MQRLFGDEEAGGGTAAPAPAPPDAPLATRMRPRSLEEFVGQERLLAPGSALRRAVEGDRVTLIGATTENPYFEVNSALISRAHVYELAALERADVRVLLERAVARGEVGAPARVTPEALDFLAARSDGDARTALNA